METDPKILFSPYAGGKTAQVRLPPAGNTRSAGSPAAKEASVLSRAASWSMDRSGVEAAKGNTILANTASLPTLSKGASAVDIPRLPSLPRPARAESKLSSERMTDGQGSGTRRAGEVKLPWELDPKSDDDVLASIDKIRMEASVELADKLPHSSAGRGIHGTESSLDTQSAKLAPPRTISRPSTRSSARRGGPRPSMAASRQTSSRPGRSAVGLMKELISTQKRMDGLVKDHEMHMEEMRSKMRAERSAAEEAIGSLRSTCRQQLAAAQSSIDSWYKRCLESERQTYELRGKLLKLSSKSVASGDPTPSGRASGPAKRRPSQKDRGSSSATAVVETENLRRELNQAKHRMYFTEDTIAKLKARNVTEREWHSMRLAEAESLAFELRTRMQHQNLVADQSIASLRRDLAVMHSQAEEERHQHLNEVQLLEAKATRLDAESGYLRRLQNEAERRRLELAGKLAAAEASSRLKYQARLSESRDRKASTADSKSGTGVEATIQAALESLEKSEIARRDVATRAQHAEEALLTAKQAHLYELSRVRRELQGELDASRQARSASEAKSYQDHATEQARCKYLQAQLHESYAQLHASHYELKRLRIDQQETKGYQDRKVAAASEQAAEAVAKAAAVTEDRDIWRKKCESLLKYNDALERAVGLLDRTLSRHKLESVTVDAEGSQPDIDSMQYLGPESEEDGHEKTMGSNAKHRQVKTREFVLRLESAVAKGSTRRKFRLLCYGWLRLQYANTGKQSKDICRQTTTFAAAVLSSCSIAPKKAGPSAREALSALGRLTAAARCTSKARGLASDDHEKHQYDVHGPNAFDSTAKNIVNRRRHSLSGRVVPNSGASVAQRDTPTALTDVAWLPRHLEVLAGRVQADLESRMQRVQQQEALVRASGVLLEYDRWSIEEASRRKREEWIRATADEMRSSYDLKLQEQAERVKRQAYEVVESELRSDHAMDMARERKLAAYRLTKTAKTARRYGRNECKAQLKAMAAKLGVYRSRLRNAEDETKALRALHEAGTSAEATEVTRCHLQQMTERHGQELTAMAERMQEVVAQVHEDMVRERQLAGEEAGAAREYALVEDHGRKLQEAQYRFTKQVRQVAEQFEARTTRASKRQFELEAEVRRLEVVARRPTVGDIAIYTEPAEFRTWAVELVSVPAAIVLPSAVEGNSTRSYALERQLMYQEDCEPGTLGAPDDRSAGGVGFHGTASVDAVRREAQAYLQKAVRQASLQAERAATEGFERGREEGRREGRDSAMKAAEELRLQEAKAAAEQTDRILERERKSRADVIKKLRQSARDYYQSVKDALAKRHDREMRREMKTVAIKAAQRIKALEVEVEVLRKQCDGLVVEADTHRDRGSDLEKRLLLAERELLHVRRCGTALRARLFMAAMKFAGLHSTAVVSIRRDLHARIAFLEQRHHQDTQVLRARTEVAAERARELEYLLGRVSSELCVTHDLRVEQRKALSREAIASRQSQRRRQRGPDDSESGSEADSAERPDDEIDREMEAQVAANPMLQELREAMAEAAGLRLRIDDASARVHASRRELLEVVYGSNFDRGSLMSLKEELKANLLSRKQAEMRVKPGQEAPLDDNLVERLQRLERRIAFHQARHHEREYARERAAHALEGLKDERRAWKLRLRALEGRTLSAVVKQHDATRQLILAAGVLQADGVVSLLKRVPEPQPLLVTQGECGYNVSPATNLSGVLQYPSQSPGSESGRSSAAAGTGIRLGQTPPPRMGAFATSYSGMDGCHVSEGRGRNHPAITRPSPARPVG